MSNIIAKTLFLAVATVYKAQNNKLLNEIICKPVSPYGNTKLIIETILEDLLIVTHQNGELLR